MKIKKYVPHLMLLAAAMIWGFGFTAQDAIESLSAFSVGALRSWIAGIFLIFVIIVFDKAHGNKRRLFSSRGIDLTRTELVGGIACGAVLAVAFTLQQLGIASGTDGGKAAFISSLYVVLVPIYALAVKKRAPINVWVSVAIAAVGFYFLCVKDNFSISAADLTVVACALVFPVHILLIDRFSPGTDGVRLSCVQFLASAVIQTAAAILMAEDTAAAVWINIIPLLFLGIFSGGIAYTLQIVAQSRIDPTAASIIMSLESVFGVIGTSLVLHSTLTEREYIGCFIVFLAVILSELEPKRKKAHGDAPKT